MKWTPDTHEITFEIQEVSPGIFSCSSFVGDYEGEPQEVYEQVLAEHRAINMALLEE